MAKKKQTPKETPTRKYSKRKPETAKQLSRPTKFTKENRETIYKSLYEVPFMAYAAQKCGITKRTIEYWMQKGNKDNEENIDSEFAIFFRRVNEIRAEVEHDLFSIVKLASTKSPGEAKYILQCLKPKTYGMKQAVKVETDSTPEEQSAFSEGNFHLQITNAIKQIEGDE